MLHYELVKTIECTFRMGIFAFCFIIAKQKSFIGQILELPVSYPQNCSASSSLTNYFGSDITFQI